MSSRVVRLHQAYSILKNFWDSAIEVEDYIPEEVQKDVQSKLNRLLLD